jgi:DNA-binding HxlR family transcriptional regulator
MVVGRFQRIEALRIQVDHVHLQRVMPQLLGGLRGQMGVEGAGFGMGKQDQARMGRGVWSVRPSSRCRSAPAITHLEVTMAYPGDVYAADCSARDALALISGKWVMLLLPALAQGPQRNGALLRKIEGISQKVLTQTLRQLERNGLVERCDLGSKPLHVEYRLTEVARGLVDTLSALDRWAEHNFPALDAARERFDAR